MAERKIWKRFMRRHWFVMAFGFYIVACVVFRFAPSIFPDWAVPIVTLFSD